MTRILVRHSNKVFRSRESVRALGEGHSLERGMRHTVSTLHYISVEISRAIT
jgi:hypothetical protein